MSKYIAPVPPTGLLQTAQVAERLGVTTARIRQLAQAGTLKPAKTATDGTRFFRPGAVERLRAARVKKLVGQLQQLGSTSQP